MSQINSQSQIKRDHEKISSDAFTGAPPGSNAWLLHTGQFPDLFIKCGQRVFKTHRCVVCTQSEYLKSLLPVEKDSPDAEKVIKICTIEPDMDGDLMEQVIKYLYTDNYTDDPDKGTSKSSKPSSVVIAPGTRDSPVAVDERSSKPLAIPSHKTATSAGPSKPGLSQPQAQNRPTANKQGGSFVAAQESVPLPRPNPAMFFNTRMYVAAHKIQLDALKVRAGGKFHERFGENSNPESLAQSIEFLYEKSKKEPSRFYDALLNDIAILSTIDNYNFVNTEVFRKLVSKCPDFAVKVVGHLHIRIAQLNQTISHMNKPFCSRCKDHDNTRTRPIAMRKDNRGVYHCEGCGMNFD